MSIVLSVEDLCKIYPEKKTLPAVDKISFDLHSKEILGFLGPNGSGKTTTIQMLLGTLDKTSGSIRYFGKEFEKNRSEILQSISYASAYTSLPYLLTVEENLLVFGRLYGMSPKESARRFDPLLKRFGILDKKKTRLASLSAGQITRVMLVKAFFTEPRIVLLDEPTASLDPDMANEICDFLLEQREKFGLSILFTSHRMEEASILCDRVIFLKQGKIIANDLPQKLAESVSLFLVRLIIIDGMKRTIALASERNFEWRADHRTLEIFLREKEIPTFLNALSQADVSYAGIKIQEPSLEKYFLQIARQP